jgi:hypothetical protein
MKGALNEVMGQILDAVMRGICIGITFCVAWLIVVPIIRKAPTLLKVLELW